ncbi:MAG: hypothetical protein KGL39_31690 [Patescibacteria group bacterium]|nr:hypothetical protein [Patescibacteria group bacterium]
MSVMLSDPHIVAFWREELVELERRACFLARRSAGERRSLLHILAARLRHELSDHAGHRVALLGPGKWFVWMAEEVASPKIAFRIGQRLTSESSE